MNQRKFCLNGLEIGIDIQTGCIRFLSYPATGEILNADSKKASLINLAYPIPEFNPLRLSTQYSKAKISEGDNEITIIWDKLGASRKNFNLPEGKVSAKVIFRAASDKRSIILTCKIENHSSASIPQVLFPDFNGLRPFDGSEQTQLRFARGVVYPFNETICTPDSAQFYERPLGWREYPPGGYYRRNSLRWIDFGSLKGGLSIFERKWGYDDRSIIRTRRNESDPTFLQMHWEHKVTIKPGESWESGEFWFTPHKGGWAKGIEVFREYVNQVNPPRKLPRHIREGLGFQTIWMIQSIETDPEKAVFRFKDLPKIAKDAKAHGIDEIVPWSWCNYFSLPILARNTLGTKKEFLEGLKKAKKMGVNISPFISVQLILNTEVEKYGVKPVTEGWNWTYHPELIPIINVYYAHIMDGTEVNTGNELWQKDVWATLKKWIEEGMTSFGWDVFVLKSNDGKKPPLIILIEKLRDLARARDPESVFFAESIHTGNLEVESQIMDYTWNWVDYYDLDGATLDAGPILNVLRSPRINIGVENSPLVVKKAFCEGLYLNLMPRKPNQPNGTSLISDILALSDALKIIAPLRKQFLEYFINGTFVGDSILLEPTSAFVRAHHLKDKLLIIVLNDQFKPQKVEIKSNLDFWLPASKKYQINYYNTKGKLVKITSKKSAKWSSITNNIKPLELAIFEIKAL